MLGQPREPRFASGPGTQIGGWSSGGVLLTRAHGIHQGNITPPKAQSTLSDREESLERTVKCSWGLLCPVSRPTRRPGRCSLALLGVGWGADPQPALVGSGRVPLGFPGPEVTASAPSFTPLQSQMGQNPFRLPGGGGQGNYLKQKRKWTGALCKQGSSPFLPLTPGLPSHTAACSHLPHHFPPAAVPTLGGEESCCFLFKLQGATLFSPPAAFPSHNLSATRLRWVCPLPPPALPPSVSPSSWPFSQPAVLGPGVLVATHKALKGSHSKAAAPRVAGSKGKSQKKSVLLC